MTVGESNPTVVTFKNATSVITIFQSILLLQNRTNKSGSKRVTKSSKNSLSKTELTNEPWQLKKCAISTLETSFQKPL